MSRKRLLVFGLLPALLLSAFLLCAPAWSEDDVEDDVEDERIEAGEEDGLEIPGCDFPCRLYVPSDYKRGVRLPLIFFLHGSGGKPTSWPWKSATKGKGYLIVGLSYGALSTGGHRGIQSDAASRTGMVAFIDKVRALVDEQYGIDQKHVFLSGLSMGGWGVNFYGFLDEARARYRGYCIMAAGLVQSPKPDLTVVEGLPLLLLNGANDGNLAAANRGAPIYKKAGAIVTQVVLQDEGHVPATAAMAAPLGEWLAKIQREDEHRRRLAAIQWRDATLDQPPSRIVVSLEALLLPWLTQQAFVKNAPADKPVLLYLDTDHPGKRGKPSKQAQESLRVESETFEYPSAVDTPAAARAFLSFRTSIASLDKEDCLYLHRGVAPVVLLLDRGRTRLLFLAKGRLKDAALAKMMRTLLTPEEIAAADERIARSKPMLVEMRKLRSSIESEKKILAKLRTKDATRVRKKLEKHTAAFDRLTKRYAELQEKLAD